MVMITSVPGRCLSFTFYDTGEEKNGNTCNILSFREQTFQVIQTKPLPVKVLLICKI